MRWHLIHDVISYDVICDICYRRRKRWSTWCDTSVWRYIRAVIYMRYIVWCRWRRQKNTRTTSFGRATLSAPSSTTRSCLGQPRKKGRHGSWRSTCPATRISRKLKRFFLYEFPGGCIVRSFYPAADTIVPHSAFSAYILGGMPQTERRRNASDDQNRKKNTVVYI